VQRGEFVVFLDDDVTFGEHFLANLIAPMLADSNQRIGGTAGLITNELGGPLSRCNRAALRLVLGCDPLGAEGRLIGPAFQMPLLSAPSEPTPVEWMPCCCAYRAAALGSLRFREHFSGYSFMEDVDLSYRVSRSYQLLVVPKARLVHLGMGSASQPDWFRDGKQRIINRHFVLRHTMRDRRMSSLLRLLAFELLYTPMASLRACIRDGQWSRAWQQIAGRFSGALSLAGGRSS
jgi:GT2 family glycosyltransferase